MTSSKMTGKFADGDVCPGGSGKGPSNYIVSAGGKGGNSGNDGADIKQKSVKVGYTGGGGFGKSGYALGTEGGYEGLGRG